MTCERPWVRIPLSPPFFYSKLILEWHFAITSAVIKRLPKLMEKYSRGRRGAPAKGVGRAPGARVQIPPFPPNKSHKRLVFFAEQDLNTSDVARGYSRFLHTDNLK